MRVSHVCWATLVNSHGLSSSFDRVDEKWTKLLFKFDHSALTQLSSSIDCAHKSWTKLSFKFGHSALAQLSSLIDRVHKSWTKLSFKAGQPILIQLSGLFDSCLRFTQIIISWAFMFLSFQNIRRHTNLYQENYLSVEQDSLHRRSWW